MQMNTNNYIIIQKQFNRVYVFGIQIISKVLLLNDKACKWAKQKLEQVSPSTKIIPDYFSNEGVHPFGFINLIFFIFYPIL